jgi:hypothetical protein
MRTTVDARRAAASIYQELIAGTITNQTARARLMAIKVMIDTVKVEIAAAHLTTARSSVELIPAEDSLKLVG